MDTDTIAAAHKRSQDIIQKYSEYVDSLMAKHLEAMDEMMEGYKSHLDILMEKHKKHIEQFKIRIEEGG